MEFNERHTDVSTEFNPTLNASIASDININGQDSGKRFKCSWAAPHPNFQVAFATWGAFWEFHVYFFGSFFVLLAIQSLVCFVLDVLSHFLSAKSSEVPQKASPLSISLHALIFSATSSRSINLFADPYGTKKALPCPLGPVFWSCGWPGICSAFSVLLMVLLETTQLSLAPPRFQRPAVLAAVIIPSLLFVLVADLMTAYGGMKTALLICQVLFVLWGLLLCLGFGNVWWKIRLNLSSSTQAQGIQGRDNSRLKKLNIILKSCVTVGLGLSLTNLYAISATRSAALRPYFIQPISWITFQTSQRLFEVVMCTLILVSQNRSSRWKKAGIGFSTTTSSSLSRPRTQVQTISGHAAQNNETVNA